MGLLYLRLVMAEFAPSSFAKCFFLLGGGEQVDRKSLDAGQTNVKTNFY